MSGVLNDCDALLQGAAVRILNPKNASIILTPDAQSFHVNGSGVADVDTITITATLYELDGPLSFSVQGATLSSTTDRTATVTYASMTAPTAIVTATLESGGLTYSQSCIIVVTQDGTSGATAKVLTLSATEQVFKISKTGSNSPASITLTASGQNIVGTPSFTVPIGTATLTAGANASQKILTFANMTSDSVTVQIALDGLTDRVTISKLRDGADGADGIVGVLSNESVTLPAGSNGVVSSYSGAACTMKVFKGTTDDSANWTFAYAPVSSSSSLAYTGSAGTVSVVTMAAGVDSAYVDITASRTGYASITKRFSVTKSKAGASVTGDRGAGTYYATGSAWADGDADAATPGSNVTNDVVIISNGTTFAMTKKWDGAAWVAMGAIFDGSLFVTGSINGAALKAGTVEIRAPDGTLILGAGLSLAQQAASNPNLVPGPRGWSTFYSGAYSWRNGNVVFGNGEYIGLAPASSAGGYIAAESPPCGAPAGATITVSFDASCDSGTRTLSLNFFGPSVDTTAYSTVLTTTFKRYVWTITLPNVADAPKAFLRMWSSAVGAQIIISNIKVEMGSKATPWCDNAITADNAKNRVFIPNLAALSAFFGNVEIGAGGALRQGQTAYDTGIGAFFGAKANGSAALSIATNNGAKLLCDPENNILKLINAQVETPQYSAFSVSAGGTWSASARYVAGGVNFGSRTATVTGSDNLKSIQWELDFDDRYGTFYMSGANTQTVSLSFEGPQPGSSGTLTVTAIGKDGRVVSDWIQLFATVTN